MFGIRKTVTALFFTLIACCDSGFGLSPSAAATGSTDCALLKKAQILAVPDPASKRIYSISVGLPASYAVEPARRYPVLYVTDADYGFPAVENLMRDINLDEPATDEFIVVGLSYAKDEDPADSRLRDYTPIPRKDLRGGGGPAYQAYLRDTVIPLVEKKFRADPNRRVYVGHSYGALLGVQMLLTDPEMFYGYILGSPSLWYANHAAYDLETAYTHSGRDLPARIFLYVGEFEAANPSDTRYNKTLDMVKDNTDFVERLQSHGYKNLQIRFEVIAAESHLTVFPAGFTKGILDILPVGK